MQAISTIPVNTNHQKIQPKVILGAKLWNSMAANYRFCSQILHIRH